MSPLTTQVSEIVTQFWNAKQYVAVNTEQKSRNSYPKIWK